MYSVRMMLSGTLICSASRMGRDYYSAQPGDGVGAASEQSEIGVIRYAFRLAQPKQR
jgi:hypothetical protein